MDRLCPKCGQRYRADVATCPVHRVALVDDPFVGRALGDYGIVGYLGSGAMGVVYRAEPPAAIKILNVVRARMQPELVRRFELEAKAIARLRGNVAPGELCSLSSTSPWALEIPIPSRLTGAPACLWRRTK